MAHRRNSSPEIELPLANPWIASALAWLIPGAGHAFLRRAPRGAFFFALIVGALAFGCSLGGYLPWQFSGSPLFLLASLGTLGSGLPVLIARFVFDYSGELTGAGFEYGRAFIITAGLMNWMLVLDAWDIAWGKEAFAPAAAEPDNGSEGEDDGAEQRAATR
ncbi:MAG: DUF6677 family protein [Acidobacteriota bacterium]